MDTSSWFQLVIVCLIGAMSPGPSLGLVINNALSGGRRFGILTSFGHGIGITIWALLTAVGIASLVVANQGLLVAMQLAGACLLIYIGARTVLSSNSVFASKTLSKSTTRGASFQGATEGFLISILNPKIAVFFLAIFSHFVSENSSWTEAGLMGVAAGTIDAAWYALVTITITGSGISTLLRTRETIIRRVSGALLLLIAANLLIIATRQLIGDLGQD